MYFKIHNMCNWSINCNIINYIYKSKVRIVVTGEEITNVRKHSINIEQLFRMTAVTHAVASK